MPVFGEKIEEFCLENALNLTHTFFYEKYKSKLYNNFRNHQFPGSRCGPRQQYGQSLLHILVATGVGICYWLSCQPTCDIFLNLT